MKSKPNRLDRSVAKILSGQGPVLIGLLVLAVGSLLVALRLGSDQYLQAACVEVSVGSLFFFALYLSRAEKFSPGTALGWLVFGAVLFLLGWEAVRRGLPSLVSSYLLELASASILYVVIELVIRGILLRAEARNAALAEAVQKTRLKTVAEIKDAVFVGAVNVLMTVDALKSRSRQEIEEDLRQAPWEPNIPEPLFQIDDGAPNWSWSGIFGWKPADEEATTSPA